MCRSPWLSRAVYQLLYVLALGVNFLEVQKPYNFPRLRNSIRVIDAAVGLGPKAVIFGTIIMQWRSHFSFCSSHTEERGIEFREVICESMKTLDV